MDDDCDGRIDEELPDVLFLDRDGDGHGDPLTPLGACADDGTASMLGDDCDDLDASVYPGARDDCDGVDDDCDGRVDFGAICGAPENYACVDGRCVVHTCPEGRADCNGVAADGCEAVLGEDVDHCGSCGRSCRSSDGARSCVDGECTVSRCAADHHACGEVCYANDDISHCGSMCVECPLVQAHGASVCRSGCAVACDEGFVPYITADVVGCTYRDPHLVSLRVIGHSMAPFFASSVRGYAVSVPSSVDAISLIAEIPPGSDLELTIDGAAATPGAATPIAVPMGMSRHEVGVASLSEPARYVLWVLRGEPTASRIDDPDVAPERRTFGSEVAVSGHRVAALAHATSGDPGAVTVHERVGAAWRLDGTISPPEGTAFDAIAIDGDWLAVGAAVTAVGGVEGAGAVLLYRRRASGWVYETTLTASMPGAGYFGIEVAIEGSILVVGAPREPGTAPGESGAVYVYQLAGEACVLDERLAGVPGASWFGEFLEVSGEVVAVGARVFEMRPTGWTLLGPVVPPPGVSSLAGRLAMDGDLIAVAGSRSGSGDWVALLYERVGDEHVYVASFEAPNGPPGSFAGPLALDGDLLVAGVPSERGRPGRPFDSSLAYAGAVYAFRGLRSPTPEVWYLKSSAVPPRANANFGLTVAVDDGTIVVGAGPSDAPRWLDVFVLP